MKRTWTGSLALASSLVLTTGPALGSETAMERESRLLYSELASGAERFGLVSPETGAGQDANLALAQEGAAPMGVSEGSSGPSPLLAGMMSAIVPGTGQLVQGQTRGWLYLGVEVAAWFSYGSLRSAGNQAEEDYRQFADQHWDWDRYSAVTDCGEGLGPVNFEEESALLLDLYENSPDRFYDDIGSQDVYACGWDVQTNRASYRSMQNDADNLFKASEFVVAAVVVNHLVSAIDAAKSASNRRKAEKVQSINWNLSPTPAGDLALKVELSRTF